MLKFNQEMYNNPVGSFVICSFILSKEHPTLSFLKKKWVKYKKLIQRDDLLVIHPDTFIEDTRSFFRLSDENIPICVVKSKWNTLFLPYIINGDKCVITPLPIREDGVFPQTVKHSESVQVVDWSVGVDK